MLRTNWNLDWTFFNGTDAPKKVNLPYDAMIHEERISRLKDGTNSGFFPGGLYTYEKTFMVDEKDVSKTTLLEFEGVYQKSKVYINDVLAGGRNYGYSRFYVDLTGKLTTGENVVKVIADNTQMMNCRWYSGSGIYRDVNLLVAGENYLKPDGIFVTTESVDPAVLRVQIDAEKTEEQKIVTEVSYKGAVVATAEGADISIEIPDVKLWDAENPNLYDITVKLLDNDTVIDEAVERTGIRTLTIDAENGLLVNGKEVKLRGACIHHDHGPLGASSYKKAELRRAKTLKEAGFNAIRTAHNSFNKAFLDACDEVGLYVMHETFDSWINKKTDYDYALYFEQEWKNDLSSMVLTSRNHPSVILYGVGNEIFETGLEEGARINQELVAKCKELDPTRYVVNCINPLCTSLGSKKVGLNEKETSPEDIGNPRQEDEDSKQAGSALANSLVTLMPMLTKIISTPKKMMKIASDVFEALDVVGFNYSSYLIEPIHEKTGKVIVNSETCARKIFENWKYAKKYPYFIGDFCWTGWDYLGETGVGLPLYGVSKGQFSKPYPCVSAGCGSVDLSGKITSQAAYSKAVWGLTDIPYIGVRPVNHVGEKYFFGQWRGTDAVDSWTWNGMEGHDSEVEIFSDAPVVELFQDGVSLGKKKTKECKVKYQNTYRPGELVAVAYDATGNEIGRNSLKTASDETILSVNPEETMIAADGLDIVYVTVNVTDNDGIVKMLDEKTVKVSVEGAGELIAVGSGKVDTTEKFDADTYTTHEGRMIAVIRSNGKQGVIKVTAEAEGLSVASCEITAE